MAMKTSNTPDPKKKKGPRTKGDPDPRTARNEASEEAPPEVEEDLAVEDDSGREGPTNIQVEGGDERIE